MYRLITCDLDETLLNSQRQVSERNRQAIAAAKEKGVYFVPTTGRGYRSIEPTLTELQALNQKEHYMIGFNGGIIMENYGAKLLDSTAMDFQMIQALFEIGKDLNVAIHVNTFEMSYIYNASEMLDFYNNSPQHHLLAVPDISNLKNQTCYKIIFQNSDVAYLRSLEELIPADLKAQLDISYSSNRYMEFNPLGVTKGAALKKLAQHLDVPLDQTIAIGDNINDLSMLETAALGVAVANAVPEVKKLATFTTTADHNQSAIAEMIEKFIL